MTAEFVYNADGLRVQKTINGVATKYTLHGKNIVHMTSGTDELHFFYDAQNRPAVVVYNGTAYAYVKSLQGDIVAILDENGNAVVSYGYDAWGAPLWCTGELAETLGKVQPFRYRGYVFDEETGLYYLRSRYYNPQWGRFVNADCILDNCNIFLYCDNQAPCNVDYDGFNPNEETDSKKWEFRIDTKHGKLIAPGIFMKHLHLIHSRTGDDYAINADGSQHDAAEHVMTPQMLEFIRKDKKIKKKWPPRDGDGNIMYKDKWIEKGWEEDDFVSKCEFAVALPLYNSFPLDAIALMNAPAPTVGAFDFSLAGSAASFCTSVKSTAGSFYQSFNNACGISDLFTRKLYDPDLSAFGFAE